MTRFELHLARDSIYFGALAIACGVLLAFHPEPDPITQTGALILCALGGGMMALSIVARRALIDEPIQDAQKRMQQIYQNVREVK